MIKKSLVCFLSVIIIGGMVFMAIPSYAYAPNGVDLVPIELTNEDIKSMFDNGDVTVFFNVLSSISMNINVYDMINQSKSLVNIPGNNIVGWGGDLESCQIVGNYIIFYTDYAFSQRAENGELYLDITISLPFEYYLGNSQLTFRCFYSGNSNGDPASFRFRAWNKNNDVILDNTKTNTRVIYFWEQSNQIKAWQNLYNWIPEGYTMTQDTSTQGIRTCTSFATFTNLSTDELINDIQMCFTVSTARASGSGTGYDYFYCAPVLMQCNFNTTVYVDPEYEDVIKEYLDLIVNPSPEDEERIEELKDKFASTVDDLEDASDNLHKDMPDLPDVTDLDEDVTEGMEEATENVMNSMLGIGVVNTILGATFIFAVIKILLYGSGPY